LAAYLSQLPLTDFPSNINRGSVYFPKWVIREETRFRLAKQEGGYMHKFILSIVLIGIGGLFFGNQVRADKEEKELARVPVEKYLEAQKTGNPEFIHKAFYTDAKIMTFRDGKLSNLSVAEFAARFNGKPAEDEAQRKRTIESLDVSGNAASAKVVLDYPTAKFTDYLNLVKLSGEWKIVNKSFYAELK
jgi:hypothetical protein